MSTNPIHQHRNGKFGEEQEYVLGELKTAIAALTTAIEQKASNEYVLMLSAQIESKATESIANMAKMIEFITNTIDTKADKRDLSTISSKIDDTVSKSDLLSLSDKIDNKAHELKLEALWIVRSIDARFGAYSLQEICQSLNIISEQIIALEARVAMLENP